MKFFVSINYSSPHASPLPVIKRCSFVAGVKTVFNHPLGNPLSLEKVMQEKGIEIAFSDSPYEFGRIRSMKVEGVSYQNIPNKLFYLLFEYVPKSLTLQKPEDPYSSYFGECKPFLSDIPPILSFLSFQFPSYSFILGERRNLLENVSCEDIKPQNLINAIPISKRVGLSAYAYSEMGFFFAGDRVKGEARYVIRVNTKNTLIVLKKDNSTIGVYDQNYINEKISPQGSYTAEIHSYKLKVWNIYFGIRRTACIPPVYY